MINKVIIMIYNCDNLNFNILTIENFSHIKGYYKVKGRPYAAISYRLCGTAEFKMQDTYFSATPGNISFIPANVDYEVEYDGGESIVIHLSECNYTVAENISLDNLLILKNEFEDLPTFWKENNSINKTKSHIYNILQIISDCFYKGHSDSDFDKAVRFIDEMYLRTDFSIDDICKNINISSSTLRKRFQQYCGISPIEYITRLRLKKAVELLMQGGKSIKEISFICGYNDEKYFSRLIKKTYGLPPSQLKNSNRNFGM